MSVTFYTGPMSAGKSTLLLQDRYNLQKRGLSVLTASASSTPVIVSRFSGNEVKAYGSHVIDEMWDFIVTKSKKMIDYILIDEAQFMTPFAVERVISLVDSLDGCNLRAYGLTADFQGNMFPGTAKWIALSDEVQWLQGSVPCWCGEAARMNSRVVGGNVTHSGNQVLEGDINAEAGMYYVPLCRKHWREKKLKDS